MIAAAVLLAIVIAVFVVYLITRLRFAFFHCLVSNTKEIGPGWRLYSGQATRFFWLNIVVGICFMALLVLVALPFAAGFWRLFNESQQSGHFDIGLLLTLALPLIPIVILLMVAAILSDLILRDWNATAYCAGKRDCGRSVEAGAGADHGPRRDSSLFTRYCA